MSCHSGDHWDHLEGHQIVLLAQNDDILVPKAPNNESFPADFGGPVVP